MKREKRFTFTKIIVIWSMVITTIHYFISQYGTYILHTQPASSTSELIQTLIVGVIIAYMGKSGFEFYQNKKNELATMSCLTTTTNNGEIPNSNESV